MIFLFSGYDLHTGIARSYKEIKEMYRLEGYGAGTHRTLKAVMSRALTLKDDVQSWIHTHCTAINPTYAYRIGHSNGRPVLDEDGEPPYFIKQGADVSMSPATVESSDDEAQDKKLANYDPAGMTSTTDLSENDGADVFDPWLSDHELTTPKWEKGRVALPQECEP